MKHLNVCKQTDTCRHVHVNRHLRFSPLLAATNVTTCDYHVSCRNFAVGLPSLKKAPIKKKCQKGTPPFRNQQHNVCVCQQSSTPGKVQTQTLGARVSKHLLTLQKLKFVQFIAFSEIPYLGKPSWLRHNSLAVEIHIELGLADVC